MTVKNPKELFVWMLSDVREGTERGIKIWQEMMPFVQDPDIKEALEARIFVADKTLAKLDKCFQMIGERPVKATGRLHDIFVEDFRKEVGEIQSVPAKHLFILSKLNHLTHFRIGEYQAVIATADVTGHYGVGVLLESCLAEKLAFVERTKRLFKYIVETKMAERVAAA